MNYSTKIKKNKAKNIVGLITVKKFDIANTVCNFSNFLKSLLVAPWPMTLAGLILAGANSKAHDYKQKHKQRPSEKKFHKKTV